MRKEAGGAKDEAALLRDVRDIVGDGKWSEATAMAITLHKRRVCYRGEPRALAPTARPAPLRAAHALRPARARPSAPHPRGMLFLLPADPRGFGVRAELTRRRRAQPAQ